MMNDDLNTTEGQEENDLSKYMPQDGSSSMQENLDTSNNANTIAASTSS